jgi:ketosteroid isomerase-like protein
MRESDVACEVWATVQALNRAWAVDGHPERLANYFAPEMIAITPTDRLRLEGQKACIAGWTEFVHATKILRWLESNPLTLVLAEGRAAVVAYDFQIDFEAGGRVIHMSGRDLMTLEKRDGRWWLVADHFSAYSG